MPDCPRHSWRFLRETKKALSFDKDGVPILWETNGHYYCIHCLRYATRAEIQKEMEEADAFRHEAMGVTKAEFLDEMQQATYRDHIAYLHQQPWFDAYVKQLVLDQLAVKEQEEP